MCQWTAKVLKTAKGKATRLLGSAPEVYIQTGVNSPVKARRKRVHAQGRDCEPIPIMLKSSTRIGVMKEERERFQSELRSMWYWTAWLFWWSVSDNALCQLFNFSLNNLQNLLRTFHQMSSKQIIGSLSMAIPTISMLNARRVHYWTRLTTSSY
jgi:hypothetical protein